MSLSQLPLPYRSFACFSYMLAKKVMLCREGACYKTTWESLELHAVKNIYSLSDPQPTTTNILLTQVVLDTYYYQGNIQ